MTRPPILAARKSLDLVPWLAALLLSSNTLAAEPSTQALERTFPTEVRPLLATYCQACHAKDRTEADVDLSTFATFADVRKQPRVWQKAGDMLDSGQMPPKDAKQPTAEERQKLQRWVREYLTFEAAARAGDPGRVVLRRLSNAEYTYTLRDLTGVADLSPAREFPVDGAAGEGFTNAGAALVMSPALVTKYLDAAKGVAGHAVLLPDGMRFSRHTTRADWTNEILTEIREFYREFTDPRGGATVNLQGIVFDTNQGGRLPVEKYLAAMLAERDALASGKKSIAAVARERGLSAKYLSTLWTTLGDEKKPNEKAGGASRVPASLLDGLRVRCRAAKPEEAPAIAAEIARWQQALWRFTSVGHIGKVNGPKAWMEPVSPVAARQEIKLKLAAPAPKGPAAKAPGKGLESNEIVLFLSASDAGDGSDNDYVVWERPRFVAAGRPDLLLRDVNPVTRELAARRESLFASAAKCLAAAAEASAAQGKLDTAKLAQQHAVDAESLAAWLDYLGIGGGAVQFGAPITRKADSSAGYAFVKGWVGDNALSVVANSSDSHVRIPGNMKPHGVAVHPAPTRSVAIGWHSPVSGPLRIDGAVQHAHPECGNGVAWSLELRRGGTRQRLATGVSQGAKVVPIGPLEKISVQAGDAIALVINPRDGNHSCDLTAVDLTIKEVPAAADRKPLEWSLAKDVSPDILSGNPHKDSNGYADVWHFFSEPADGASGHVIPAGSLLAKWQSAADSGEKQKLAEAVQQLLKNGVASLPSDSPDAALHRQLTSLGGPLLSAALQAIAKKPVAAGDAKLSPFGLDPALFGKHPSVDGSLRDPKAITVDTANLCVRAPSLLEVRLPADLVAGAEFVAGGVLHPVSGKEGSVQLLATTTKPDAAAGLQPSTATETIGAGPWTSNNRSISHATPILAAEGSTARRRIEASLDEFRQLFPAALCYTKIVPVDEVVTLTLYYREDDHLRRLMLDDAQSARLNRLWDELHFVSHDAVKLVDAFQQLMEFATQDADPKVFEPLRKPIHDRAAAFRRQLVDSEPKHLDAVVAFAAQAYRRPLASAEAAELRGLYGRLRQQELGHDDATRLTLARVLVSPAFLYKPEKPVAGPTQGPVSDFELASRLSYFLWSSQPDAELRKVAAAGQLREPQVLQQQMMRMLGDPKARRLATEFACQWLHIYDFDQLDEKSERHFPTFLKLRGAMYEESIQFFTDLFQHNGTVLEILDGDHTYLNEELAKHYGIPWDSKLPAEQVWRRVDGVKKLGRGGILAQSTTLAKQSGASRTSPILRGNWISEVLLGERLPRPPKDVPQLPDDETATAGLTVRQLVEKHSSDAKCAVCHRRIDPLGFSLEGFDAIGRRRAKDLGERPIDTRVTAMDGAKFDGLDGLRTYLLTTRRDAFVRQFCRKLLGYALGRSVQLSDEPLLAKMQADLKASGYKVHTIMEAIVLSRQFREIRGREAAQED